MTSQIINCNHCDAVCCRLTVTPMPEDNIDAELLTLNEHGATVMIKGLDGWCIALDRTKMRCSIYEQRPGICRKFAMAGPYCRSERRAWKNIAISLR